MSLAELRTPIARRWPFADLFKVDGVQYTPFPRSVVPSDLDGVVHLRNPDRFLFLEGKREGEREMSSAQRELLESLAKAHDVLIFWAKDNEIIGLEHVGHDPCRREASNLDFVQFCANWSER